MQGRCAMRSASFPTSTGFIATLRSMQYGIPRLPCSARRVSRLDQTIYLRRMPRLHIAAWSAPRTVTTAGAAMTGAALREIRDASAAAAPGSMFTN